LAHIVLMFFAAAKRSARLPARVSGEATVLNTRGMSLACMAPSSMSVPSILRFER
jgi:hypothetical protein